MDNAEIKRLRQVYQGYKESSAVQAKWLETNPGNDAIIKERWAKLAKMLKASNRWPLDSYTLLDVGCGSGHMLAHFQNWCAKANNLYGIDLIEDRIAAARANYPELHFQQSNAEQLDFADMSFDLVLLSTVFSSILDPVMTCNVADEVCRVLKPGGAILWYDFRYNNPKNPHVRGVTKKQIKQLFPNCTTHLKTVTLLPPLARSLGQFTPLLYPLLSIISPLRTHYIGLIIKPR